MSEFNHDHNDKGGVSRRRVLECMTWAGTGVLWTISGGVPRSLGLVGSARAAEPAGLTFLQISDSHIGFDKPANPNALGTLEEAIRKINSMPLKPSFMIHTGDITHLSKAAEFDNAERIISQAKLDVHYVPGEHDFIDEEVKLYRERYGRGAKGAGWYSFDANGVHFIGLVNVVDLKAGGDFLDDGLHILGAWVFGGDHGQVGSTGHLAHQPPLGHVAQSRRTEDGNHPPAGGNQFSGHSECLLKGMWCVGKVHHYVKVARVNQIHASLDPLYST